jgi:hypothetical protein
MPSAYSLTAPYQPGERTQGNSPAELPGPGGGFSRNQSQRIQYPMLLRPSQPTSTGSNLSEIYGPDRSPKDHMTIATEKVEGSEQENSPSDICETATPPYKACCPIAICKGKPKGNLPDHHSRVHQGQPLSDEERERLDKKFYQCVCQKLRLRSSELKCRCGARTSHKSRYTPVFSASQSHDASSHYDRIDGPPADKPHMYQHSPCEWCDRQARV